MIYYFNLYTFKKCGHNHSTFIENIVWGQCRYVCKEIHVSSVHLCSRMRIHHNLHIWMNCVLDIGCSCGKRIQVFGIRACIYYFLVTSLFLINQTQMEWVNGLSVAHLSSVNFLSMHDIGEPWFCGCPILNMNGQIMASAVYHKKENRIVHFSQSALLHLKINRDYQIKIQAFKVW